MRAENCSAVESAQRHSAAAAMRSAATSHNFGMDLLNAMESTAGTGGDTSCGLFC